MIKSMTGYGGAKGEQNAIAVTAELKSVNNRYLDVSVRLPKSCLFAEEAVRGAVAEHISRGKVDVFITVDTSAAVKTVVRVDDDLAAAYLQAVQTTAATYGLDAGISALQLVRMPDVMVQEKSDADREAVTGALTAVLAEALADFDAMRAREGERLLQEAAIYADKVAVDEETVRLRSHIAQFRHLLAAGSPAGRKLDFLVQEMNREANTTGSKCADGDIARTVIDMKAELEKIREQIQNIE